MGDQYLAGHFKSSLLPSLLWKRHSPMLPCPAGYRAPSWSWAAIDGQIRFELYRAPLSDTLELLDCNIEPVSKKVPFGGVSSGTLTIRGRVRKVLWSATRDKLINPSAASGVPETFFAETIPDTDIDQLASTPIHNSASSPMPIYCLEICTHTPTGLWRRSFPGQEDVVFGRKRTYQRSGVPKGLLLEKQTAVMGEGHGGSEIFKRVGLFAFRDVEDLDVEKEKMDDANLKEVVENEKKVFFEGCEARELRII